MNILRILCGLIGLISFLLQADEWVSEQAQTDSFALVQPDSQAAIYLDSDDYPGLHRAVANLRDDIFKVTGKTLKLGSQAESEQLVIIGSLGRSALLDRLVQEGKLDISAINSRWEAYQIQVIEQPLPGVKSALVIAGSDKRGAIYGVYTLSEAIGVSPWHWWADVPVKAKSSLYVQASQAIVDAPQIKYRGIFLNDEAPALTNWVKDKFGNFNRQFYEHVFELLLRLKANYLWPAMWNNAFADDDPRNALLADEMGIVMGTSHHEPMMRADKEWNRYGEGPWEYSTNRDNIYRFWQQGAQRHKQVESLFTLGMRGQEDEPMSEGENIGLLEQIVADQREILSATFSGDIRQVPQVWALYKEVQGFYERGMRVPDDVTLLWADDNFGNIRRLPTAEERKRSGGAGVYYHFDYVGGPRSYRWINTVPIAKIWEQMHLAWQYQADRIWIVNVGDLKPMELPTDFFLRMAWNPTAFTAATQAAFSKQWASQQFGPEYAADIARILDGYTRHNGRRKPEAVEAETYSILHYNEAGRVSAELKALAELNQQVAKVLSPVYQDSYFQLVAYPLLATQAVFELNHNLALNRLHGKQGRVTTNDYADQVRYWFNRDQQLAAKYHQLAGGRWMHMMSQPHIGYTYWRNPPANLMPVLSVHEPVVEAVADMGVAIEGSALSWPLNEPEGQDLVLPEFTLYGQKQRYIDVFNKQSAPFDFIAKTSAPWITLSHETGNVETLQRVWVSIDWQQLPVGEHQGWVHVQGTGWGGARIFVQAKKNAPPKGSGFVEADGYVAMSAARANIRGNTEKAWWATVPGHGYFGQSTSSFTHIDYVWQPHEATPYLEFPLYLFSQGEFDLHLWLAPSLGFVPDRGMRLAVGLDEQTPVTLDMLADNSQQEWERTVLDGLRKVTTPIKVEQPGHQKLRVYLRDPGVVLQKLILDTGGLYPSYLGPPESQYID
ncbi:glycosyl hydrolase 115 family protein [Bowmanella yangjiangensis]|uniref:Glycosyl hydrolase 115 family protein n=1 Tax=Bowmanella yangjiangensis TaxID=2811230 RepID=A0ABS3CNB2_9ALTE|nr:glycosyl hydrolase 115 family protein [Bowmanella yangjiangensis]MBN7818585.1 glycosyl hydrolase 115 family protein [Bowmanella yangjiangensis]